MPTTYDLYFDDTSTRPWSFILLDDDGNVLFESKGYKTKAAAASVAARKLKMNATPAAERKQQERDRKREAGLVPVQEWVHRDDAERLRKYAAKLRKARARSEA